MQSDEIGHLRNRAMECRALAKGLRDEADASLLEDIAAEFDAEAGKLRQSFRALETFRTAGNDR